MKKSTIIGIVTAIIAVACEQNADNGTTLNLSENARNYLSMKLGTASQNSMDAAAGYGNPATESFQRLHGNAVAGGRIKGDTTDTGDSTIFVDPWQTCAVHTTTENSDGSTTTVIDYGDGCEEGVDPWKYFMHGRMEYTYKNTFSQEGPVMYDTYNYTSKTVNYGGRYTHEGGTNEWNSNGESQYSGSSEYNPEEGTYSGNFEYSSDDEYSWDDDVYTYEGGAKMSYTNLSYIISESEFKYSTNEDFYHTKVLQPLVTRYDCYPTVYYGAEADSYVGCYWIPYVSGVEKITYKQDGVEGSFEIDYGNGECDFIITIIENGVRTTIDLAKDWNVIY